MPRLSIAIVFTLGLLTGCSQFDLKDNIPWGAGEDGKLGRPMKLVANWSETVMTNGSSAPMRGFGGRLVFYDREGGKPIKVAGSLTVYAFNETDGLKDDVVPDKKFVFTEEQFANHHSDQGLLKHSYSFWIPWDELGGEKKEISLLCRFVSVQGDVVVSEQSRNVLPGKPPVNPQVPESLAADHPTVTPAGVTTLSQGVQQVSYDQPVTSQPSLDHRPRMTTSTINLEGSQPGLLPAGSAQDVRSLYNGGQGLSPAPEGIPFSGLYQQPATMGSSPDLMASSQGATQSASGRSGPAKRPAPGARSSLPVRGRGLWQRPRGESRSGLAIQREQGLATGRETNRGSLFPEQPQH